MKTKALLLTVAALVAGILSSSAQVYSVNVVGYINAPLVGGTPAKYTLINNPLENKVSNAISNLFSGLPVNSQVLKWNGAGFSTYTRIGFGTGWSPANVETNVIVPGEGVFVRTPVGSAGVTNTFVGEVLQGTLSNEFPVGYSLKGNQVPVAGTADELGLSDSLGASVPNPQLLKYNRITQSYQSFSRIGFGTGWSPSVPFIAVGEGFFIRNLTGAPVFWEQNFTVN